MAAKDNMSIPLKLKFLHTLQEIDSKLDQIKILKGELPIEVQDLEDEIQGLETRVHSMKDSIGELTAGLNKHRSNIENAQALIAKYEKQLENVKNNREYEALTKEVELQHLEIQLSEKRIREGLNISKNKEATLEVSQERIEVKRKDLATKKVELEKIKVDTAKEETKLTKKRDRAQKKIQTRLLRGYNKIRDNYRNGLAVVYVDRDSCGGCFNKIPPQLQLEIRQRKKINLCEHCGRILVDNLIHDVVKES